MQLLNRAVKKDMIRFQKKFFGKALKEIRECYKLSTSVEKTSKIKRNLPKTFKSEAARISSSQLQLLVNLFNHDDLGAFKKAFSKTLDEMFTSKNKMNQRFGTELIERMPSNGFTVKNLKYFKKSAFIAHRKVLRSFRLEIEEKKGEFRRHRAHVLTQPENLDEESEKELRIFLDEYPEIKGLRNLVLRVGSIYRIPLDQIDEKLLLNLKEPRRACDELKAALKTIKKRAAEILAFKNFITSDKELSRKKSIRANNEHVMRKIKQVNRSHYGFRSARVTRTWLESRLGCPVRFNLPGLQ